MLTSRAMTFRRRQLRPALMPAAGTTLPPSWSLPRETTSTMLAVCQFTRYDHSGAVSPIAFGGYVKILIALIL